MSILGQAKKPKVHAPVRLWLYGAPNAGKTHFAKQFPNPLLLSTDGNYIYETIPANSLSSWEAGKLSKPAEKQTAVVNLIDVLKTSDEFDTVILDLIEGAYRLARNHYLGVLKIQHEGDLNYGKGYTIIRENFISTIEQLFKLPINVIIISHENPIKIEPKNAAAYTVFEPMLTDKLHETIEGYCNLVSRVFVDIDEEGNRVRKLSMSPKEHEFGINRLGDAEDVILHQNGDNYGDFNAIWSELYDARGLGGVAATNIVRKEKEKVEKDNKKAEESAKVQELSEKARKMKEARDRKKAKKEVAVTTEPEATEEVDGDEVSIPVDVVDTEKETAAEKIARIKAKSKNKSTKETNPETSTPVKDVDESTKQNVIETDVKVESIEDTQDDEPEMVRTDETKKKLARIAALKKAKAARDKK